MHGGIKGGSHMDQNKLLHILLNLVTICLVTQSVTARVSEPIADSSCIDIGPRVHPYRPDRVSASKWRNV